jgi:formylglycine-generating enzyme required for sulfatase activity
MRRTFQVMLGIVMCLALASCRDRREPLVQAGEELVNSIGMRFRRIQPGSFMMGSDKGEWAEKNAHEVTLTRGLYIGVYEVTQEEWQKVMGSNPSNFRKPRNPVNNVSWDNAQEFARRLSRKENVTYRLPTEAEWEYACRAGTTTMYYWGDKFDGRYAWNERNSGMKAHPIGLTRPNPWGLYDMSGNVGEWCEDRILFGGYSDRAVVDPRGDIIGRDRAIRGGDFHWEPKNCRSTFRSGSPPSGSYANVGFRLVRTLSETRAGDVEDVPQATPRPPGDELVLTLPGTTEVKLTMRRIPAGSFIMGLPTEQTRREIRSFNIPGPVPDQGPTHEVTLSKAFYMGVYEVTQEQWEAVIGKNPAHFGGNPKHPVESVSWDDIQAFLEKLNTMGLGTFRLPAEAEWEYACRADTTTSFYWGNDPDGGMIAEYAWFDRNSREATHPVGQKKPNPWGLYDMGGNVFELCQDFAGDYPSESQTDPAGPESGSDRISRGGCWCYPSRWCRSALRQRHSPSRGYKWYGFRLVREIE